MSDKLQSNGGRELAAMYLLFTVWGNIPFEEIHRAKASLSFNYLIGHHTTNLAFYSHIVTAVGTWATTFAVLYLLMTKERFTWFTLAFLVTLTGVFSLIFAQAASADIPGWSTVMATVSPITLVAVCVTWARRNEIISFIRRLRIRAPLTLSPR